VPFLTSCTRVAADPSALARRPPIPAHTHLLTSCVASAWLKSPPMQQMLCCILLLCYLPQYVTPLHGLTSQARCNS